MKIVKATESDAPELTKFFACQILHGPVDIQIVRPGHFFDQYRLQSSEFDVFVLKTNENEIRGMATIIYRKAFIAGNETYIGYCTDLRVAPDRETILTWTKHFLPVLQDAMKERNCKYFFSVVVPQDSRAYNALVRPRSARRNIPRFYMLARFELVTVMGRLPWATKPLSTIDIQRGENKDFEPLLEYLQKSSQERTLSYVYTPELLRERLTRWPGFSIESFFIARDSKGKIIGCVAPWDSFEVQNFVVREYHGFTKTLKTAVGLASYTGIAQALPDLNKSLNFMYLTHLYADNPDIFYSLLYESYEIARPNKSLVYGHFVNHLTTLPPRPFLSTTLPLAVYSLLPPDQPLPDFLRMSRLVAAPDIEVAFI
ncbi:MAG: hypothetical protein AB7F59_05410 [Bdellovibrionales bacterium]